MVQTLSVSNEINWSNKKTLEEKWNRKQNFFVQTLDSKNELSIQQKWHKNFILVHPNAWDKSSFSLKNLKGFHYNKKKL